MRAADDRQSGRAGTRAAGTLQLFGLLIGAILTVLTVGLISVAGPDRAVAAASSPGIARLGTASHQMGESAPACVASREHTATTAVTAYGQRAWSVPGHLVSYDYEGAHGLLASVLPGGSHGYDPSARTMIASRWPSSTFVAAEAGSGSVDEALSQLRAGRTQPNLEVDTPSQLQEVYDRLSQGGSPVQSTYPGKMVELPDGTRVGLRTASKSGGPTIDVFKPDGTHVKVHLP